MTTRILDKPPVLVREFGDLRSAIHSRTPFWVAPSLRQPDVEPAISAMLEEYLARHPEPVPACTADDPFLVYILRGAFAEHWVPFEDVALVVSRLTKASGRFQGGAFARDMRRIPNMPPGHPAHVCPATALETRMARTIWGLTSPRVSARPCEQSRRRDGKLVMRELSAAFHGKAGAASGLIHTYKRYLYFFHRVAEETTA
jgi:hypothetical protein